MTGIEYLKKGGFDFIDNMEEADVSYLGRILDKFAQMKVYELNPTIKAEDIKSILSQEQRWLQVVSMQVRARSTEMLIKHIDKFVINAISRGEENMSLIEWKKYFINWCKYNPVGSDSSGRASHSGLTAN